MDKTVMAVKDRDCVGCKACGMLCPVGAITYERNREGFEYPIIDANKCIQCGKCLAGCMADKKPDKGNSGRGRKLYAARNKDKVILKSSSSGGIFSALANDIIFEGGCVYGVCFDKEFRVVYKRGTSIEDIESMRGSKYVEAYVSMDILEGFVEDVKGKRNILFSGTPCQILGMKKMCRQMGLSTENVTWVDFFVCSGKVSSYLWEEEKQGYLKKGQLEQVSFRSKRKGWKNYEMHWKAGGKSYDYDSLTYRWNKFFGNSVARRKTCKACEYQGRGGADISLGDFWYSAPLPKEWRDNQEISVVGVNTDSGRKYFERIQGQLEVREVTDLIKEHYKYSDYDEEEEDTKRKTFWDIYEKRGYDALCEQYAKITWKERILYGMIRPVLIKIGLLDVMRKKK